MPTLSSFFGVTIKMYSEPNSKHKLPHLHAEYQDEQAVYDFYGNIIEGEIQPNKHKLVVAWIEIHREDLISNWNLLQEGKKYFKITPLR